MANRYDAIVIGSGHNGLIAAAYLAKVGKRVLVLERREVIGGATVTEETWPGYKLSTCSYVCNLLLPEAIRDLDLKRHGYDVRAFDPQHFVPFPDGRFLMSLLDDAKTKEQIAKFSTKDVPAHDAYWAMWDRIVARMRPLLTRPAPTQAEIEEAFDGPQGEEDWRTLTEKSIAEVLDGFFESEEVKAPLCVGGVIGTNAGPHAPGAIEHIEVLGPPDIEARIGITSGNIFHGEITPDQMFANRPVPGYAGYKTPVDNLYLCGSGAWPGGAVFGAPGRNCAMEVLATTRETGGIQSRAR